MKNVKITDALMELSAAGREDLALMVDAEFARLIKIESAAIKTLSKNRHLADGSIAHCWI